MSRAAAESITVAWLSHRYPGQAVDALTDIDLHVPAGTTAAIVGPSGSGKSTLLTLIAGLHRPTRGTIHLGDTDLTTQTETRLLQIRATRLAVVTQDPFRTLLPYATCLENLHFAARAPRSHGRAALPDPHELLHDLGLDLVAGSPAARLSGGERQRLALAAGLATGPTVLLCDEPTSQLDAANRHRTTALLQQIATERHVTVVAVTHDHDLAAACTTAITLDHGHLQGTRHDR
ncbi:ABC transporter ATP-binding protein [Amnibacterium endophyticum]|uniref:ABC transporter ATP-binding protein n=1 Tax=Amnibacterium endophyticum TaxID=2109337 RepID=A0ABW4LFT3_9MICO